LQLSLNNHSVDLDVNGFISSCLGENGCPGEPFLCPLSRVVAGSAVRIKQISAPPEISHRLREMGFCEEQQIKLVSRQTNLICQVCNARLGISTQLAEAILVEPIASGNSDK
jgi:Fe2+ transport system protein FeoA